MTLTGFEDDGVLLYAWRGCLFRVPDGVQPPKAGSRFFARTLSTRPGERVLEIGSGMGLAAVLLARAGAHVVATDVVPAALDAIRANAALNGVTIDARLGDCYAPVAGERFDLVCANAPQMPTPPTALRTDTDAVADNGGPDGWSVLDRVIDGAPAHLLAGGRLAVTIFAFLGVKKAFAKLEAHGFTARVAATEVQPFPRLAYERLEHIRAIDDEATVPRVELPHTVERLLVEARLGG